MTALRLRQLILLGLLTCLIVPILLRGTSAVDRVHGLSGPLQPVPTGAGRAEGGLFQ